MNKLPMLDKDINCPHFPLCSGCQIDKAVDAPPILDEARRYFKAVGIADLKCRIGPATEWRYRAKLAVRGSFQEPLIGLYKEGTHEVVDIPLCKVHHPKINQAVERLRSFIKRKKLSPYNEMTATGLIRYAQFVVERSTGRVQLSIVLNTNSLEIDIVKELWDGNQDQFWHSLWLNGNTRRDNVIFGDKWQLLDGEPLLWEKLGGVEICFQPSSFAQANLELYDEMLESIKRMVPQGTCVAEFYAGVGVIGLALAEQCREVRCSEVNPHAEFCFEQSRKRLSANTAERITWQQGRSAQLLQLLDGAEVVIVDPPRQGLESALLKKIMEAPTIRRLIYVSCGWKSFQRDANELLGKGWVLSDVEVYLFFPGSDHIETLALFETQVDMK